MVKIGNAPLALDKDWSVLKIIGNGVIDEVIVIVWTDSDFRIYRALCPILPNAHLIFENIFKYIHWYQTKISVRLAKIGYKG